MRATDEIVEGFLQWARNYGEIESYKKIAKSGRKWHITRSPSMNATASGADAGDWILSPAERVVPAEFVLTSREAIAFGYGLAVAGARPETRAEFAKREWDW